MEAPQLLCSLSSPVLDWRANGLRCLSAISCGNARLTEVPERLVLPEAVRQLCAVLWQNTVATRKEWGAMLYTINEADIYFLLDQGESSEITWNISWQGEQPVAIPMFLHTHPNQTWPSVQDIASLLGRSNLSPAELIVAGTNSSFLLLRDNRGRKPSCCVYLSQDHKNFQLADPSLVKRIYNGSNG